jgi:hypothetical protein
MPTKADLLFDALKFSNEDQQRLTASILSRYQDAYQDAIQQQLTNLGRMERAKRASGRELIDLTKFVKRDVTSIASTYNNDLRREISRQLAANPDGGLRLLQFELRAWQLERMVWKDQQISRASAGNGGEYARQKFYEKNKLTGQQFIWDAAPPIIANSHKTCIQRVKAGAVDWQTAKAWERVHANCRHTRQLVGQPAIKGDVWRG